MKVLFAVSNEKISDAIVKKYQREYKEIISYKNVYYFNAILKELQKDKSYDRVVISEDLEPFANNNYEAIDKFIFEKLDAISDEASDSNGNDTPIILICTDRRVKAEPLLVKLFGIGVYSALLGQERSIDQVCQLIAKPRTKKEAKNYYHIDSEEVNYQAENENDVSEVEIQNILTHYKRLGKNEEKYVESFNNIAAQYSDSQLRIISKFLPLNVRAVLEERSPKYQSIMTFKGGNIGGGYTPNRTYQEQKEKDNGLKIGFIDSASNKPKLSKPVVIPSSVNTSNVRKLSTIKKPAAANNKEEEQQEVAKPAQPVNQSDEFEDIINSIPTGGIVEERKEVEIETPIEKPVETIVEEPVEKEVAVPKRRGRPRKVLSPEEQAQKELEAQMPKRRGRPRKIVENPVVETKEEKQTIEESPAAEPIDLFNLAEEPEVENVATTKKQTPSSEPAVLPGIDEIEVDEEPTFESLQSNFTHNPEPVLNTTEPDLSSIEPISNNAEPVKEIPDQETEKMEFAGFSSGNMYGDYTKPTNTENVIGNANLDSLLTREKKLVAFVGTSKNGTSFLVNNLAELLSSLGIKTAILDMTQNRNSYYIYTKNEETLRKTAFNCIGGLVNGVAEGIKVNKNLTVYTSLPGENKYTQEYEAILSTLITNNTLVLIDCDFETPAEYFKEVQEIYLVQSMDVLTIQPLTAFLRDLKAKNILAQEKIRIVINQELKVRSLTEKVIIGGMACYNDPAMSFMTELFDRDTVKYCTIPFEMQTYSKYLEGLVNCKISINGYSKNFIASLKVLGNMVYPLISGKPTNKVEKQFKPVDSYEKKTAFGSDMNRTLEQMKNRY